MLHLKKHKSLSILSLLLLTVFLSSCQKLVVLFPKGPVGQEESWLIFVSFILMLIVVIPVFVMTIWFTIKYRATNTKANYMPKWAHSTKIEWFIWLIPIAIIIALGYLTVVKTRQLDPYKKLSSTEKSVQVEVISTDWNWLFIYPDEHIAVTNELVIPSGVPVSFKLTSASVMTALFIPHLGSQMYVMAGMQTQLNLMASDTGIFEGHNQEYSGNGYNTMHFDVKSVSKEDFREWLNQAKQSPEKMDMTTYHKFSTPNTNYPVTLYSSVEPELFNIVLNQFMGWMGGEDHNMDSMKHEGHQVHDACCQDSAQKEKCEDEHHSMAMPDTGAMNHKTMEEN